MATMGSSHKKLPQLPSLKRINLPATKQLVMNNPSYVHRQQKKPIVPLAPEFDFTSYFPPSSNTILQM